MRKSQESQESSESVARAISLCKLYDTLQLMSGWMRLVVNWDSELTAGLVGYTGSVFEWLGEVWDEPAAIHGVWDHPAGEYNDVNDDESPDDHYEWSWSPSDYMEEQESEWEDWDDNERRRW